MNIILILEDSSIWSEVCIMSGFEDYEFIPPETFVTETWLPDFTEKISNHKKYIIGIRSNSEHQGNLREYLYSIDFPWYAIVLSKVETTDPREYIKNWEPRISGIDTSLSIEHVEDQLLGFLQEYSPIDNLMSYIRGSLINIAPEKIGGLNLKEFNWYLVSAREFGKNRFWVFSANAATKTIKCSKAPLEILWSVAYIYSVFYLSGNSGTIDNQQESIAEEMLSRITQILEGEYEEWPNIFPVPGSKQSELIVVADELFLAACGWFFRHEAEHIIAEHLPHVIESRKAESDADEAATKFLLEEISDPKILQKRAHGIAIGLLCLSYVAYATSDWDGEGNYPTIENRIYSAFQNLSSDGDSVISLFAKVIDFTFENELMVGGSDKQGQDLLSEICKVIAEFRRK